MVKTAGLKRFEFDIASKVIYIYAMHTWIISLIIPKRKKMRWIIFTCGRSQEFFSPINHILEITQYEIMLHLFTTWMYYEKQYSPFRFPPTFRKHAAPRFRYAGSWAKGIPFKLERNGRSRKMKRACMAQQQRFSVSKRQSKWFISQNGTRITRNFQRIIEYQEVIVPAFLFSVLTRNLQLSKKWISIVLPGNLNQKSWLQIYQAAFPM